MAYSRQRVIVLPSKKGKTSSTGNQSVFIAVKKTGYYNFSVNGTRYYCDERINTRTMNQQVLFVAFSGGTKATQAQKKGKITVTKKK